MNAIDNILAQCEQIDRLQKIIKDRAMIFQADEKERIARANGLPFDAYFDLTYAEWCNVYNEYDRKKQ